MPAPPTRTAPGQPAQCTQSSITVWRPLSSLRYNSKSIWLFHIPVVLLGNFPVFPVLIKGLLVAADFCQFPLFRSNQFFQTDGLARLNAERAELANGVKSEHPALVALTKHQNIDQLSRELLVELIDNIKVYENGNISVRFKFADEFRRIAEYIEINTTKPAVAG